LRLQPAGDGSVRNPSNPLSEITAAGHAATFLLVQGVDSRVVMALLGWSSPSQLHRYQHIVDDLRRDAAHRMASILYPPTQN
ncbi:hypothetical protein ABKW28_22705, partial [Nocardioides sp. 31GB23]